MLGTSECVKKPLVLIVLTQTKSAGKFSARNDESRHARHEQASNASVRWMALIPKVKLPRVALQRSTLQTPNTSKFVKPKDGKRYISMLGVFLTLLDKWGRPQPDKPSIHSRRPLGVHLLPWLYHGNSYWRDRANQTCQKCKKGHFDTVQTNIAVLFDVPIGRLCKNS